MRLAYHQTALQACVFVAKQDLMSSSAITPVRLRSFPQLGI